MRGARYYITIGLLVTSDRRERCFWWLRKLSAFARPAGETRWIRALAPLEWVSLALPEQARVVGDDEVGFAASTNSGGWRWRLVLPPRRSKRPGARGPAQNRPQCPPSRPLAHGTWLGGQLRQFMPDFHAEAVRIYPKCTSRHGATGIGGSRSRISATSSSVRP